MMGIIIALISGALMSIQGVFNSEVTKDSSVWVSASFVQLSAFVVCIVAWFVTGRQGSFSDLLKVENKYMLLGGAIGAFITYTVIQSVTSLGPAKAIVLIVTSQLVLAYLIEIFALFGVEKAEFQIRKVIGVVIIIVGIITFKWEKK